MMLKVGNEYLDFNESIEVEKQIKLFEDISTTDGDFSYSFELPKTLNNTRILGNPLPDNINKPVYQRIMTKLLSDGGAELYDGYLRVENVTDVYRCSFFAGNNNWFARITGLLSDLDLSRYDVEQTQANIEASWDNTEGVVFPLVDNGGLLTRSYKHVKIEDLVGAFFVKTIFNQIFVEAGIKIQGELLNDWRYQNMICLKNSKSQEEINARSAFVHTSFTARTFATITPVTWDDDSTYPYNNGSNNNFDLPNNKYVADVKMILKVEATLQSEPHGFEYVEEIFIYVNGVFFSKRRMPQGEAISSIVQLVPLNAGDEVAIRTWFGGINPATYNIIDGTVKFTPSFIYKTFGASAVPNWTKQQFVSNILRIFNVLPSYNEGDATLTLNLFENIKLKPPIDLSEYISETEVDYTEFISDYGQNSKLSYNEVEFEELKSYNTGKYFKYGQGVIEVNNDFLEPDVDIIESDFSNPIAYLNGVFDMSMERTNLIDLDEGENTEATSVTDDGGAARFNIVDDIFLVGDLVRITESTNPVYNGDWVVFLQASGYILFEGMSFDTDATATLTKLDYSYANSDDVYLFIFIPRYEVPKFTGYVSLRLEDQNRTLWGVAYFDLINTGRQINKDFIYSLSFGGIDDPLHYQVTMIESYFRLFTRVLNDPVMLLSVAHLPYVVFHNINFLSPITVKTMETTNQYYLNRISGYQESYLPCQLQLIKLP